MVIVVATAAAYASSFEGVFIFDDQEAILANPTIRKLWSWDVFMPPSHGEAVQRRPIVNASLAVNYAISGDRPGSYHALNLLMHTLAALLLYGIVRRTLLLPQLRERWGDAATLLAMVIALFWGVHPLLTDAVTYVIQRTEVLAGLFYLLTLYSVIRGADSSRPGPWHVVAVVACALAIGSKEIAISAPVVVGLYDRAFLSGGWRQVFQRRWGLYVGLAATWAVVPLVLPHGKEGTQICGRSQNEVLTYLTLQADIIAHYLRLCVWPHPLIMEYGGYLSKCGSPVPCYWGIAYGLLLATAVAWYYRPWLGFLGVWFFAILAPSSSIVPLLQQVAAEKRMYLPSAAVITLLVVCAYLSGQWLVRRGALSRQAAGSMGKGLVVCVGCALAVATFCRNRDYRDEVLMWEDVLAKLPNNLRAHVNLGEVFLRRGEYPKAIQQCEEAVRLDPKDVKAHYNMGNALVEMRKYPEAIEEYRKALEAEPDYVKAHNNLGNVLATMQRFEEAIAEYEIVVSLQPNHKSVYSNYAFALFGAGRVGDAVVQYRKAMQMQGRSVSDAAICSAYGDFAVSLQRPREALVQYQKALELAPDSASVCQRLAGLLVTCSDPSIRNGTQGVALAQRAVQLSGGCDPTCCDTLATAYAEVGRFTEAVEMAAKAASLAASQHKDRLAEAIRAKIPLYQSGRSRPDASLQGSLPGSP